MELNASFVAQAPQIPKSLFDVASMLESWLDPLATEFPTRSICPFEISVTRIRLRRGQEVGSFARGLSTVNLGFRVDNITNTDPGAKVSR